MTLTKKQCLLEAKNRRSAAEKLSRVLSSVSNSEEDSLNQFINELLEEARDYEKLAETI